LANRKKDKRHSRELRSQGWKTITVWECQIEKRSDLVIKRIAARLYDRQII
jgi:G:T-mismatch repair DNA endonuclease (very short patch repair protein)